MRNGFYFFSLFMMLAFSVNSYSQTRDAQNTTPKLQPESVLEVDYIHLTDGNVMLANILASAEQNCIKEYGFERAKKYWPRVVKKVSEPGLEEFSGMVLSVFNSCMGENLIELSSLDEEQYPYLHSKGFLEVAKVLAGESKEIPEVAITPAGE